MSMQTTIQNILSAAKSLAPVIEGLTGTTFIGPAVAAGTALIQLIDDIKHTAGESQQQLQSERDALEARINAHVDATANSLDG